MNDSKGKKSAGILLFYLDKKEGIKIFLAHHGGPIWEGKDYGAWDLPKGEVEVGEKDIFSVAKREFFEETGINVSGSFMDLGSTFNKWGKEIFIWAIKGKGNEKFISSNNFEMEWPRGSGKIALFPEMDRGKYFNLKELKVKGHSYIKIFVDRLVEELKKDKNQKSLI